MSDTLTMRALVGCRAPARDVDEGEQFVVDVERALNLSEIGWAVPADPPDWWPADLIDHAHAEAKLVAAARARQAAAGRRGPRPATEVVQ